MRKWRVSGAWRTQMKWCWDWEILMAMWGNVQKDLKAYMAGMDKGKEILKEECY